MHYTAEGESKLSNHTNIDIDVIYILNISQNKSVFHFSLLTSKMAQYEGISDTMPKSNYTLQYHTKKLYTT